MLAILGYQQHAILLVGYQWCKNNLPNDPSYFAMSKMTSSIDSMNIPSYSKMGKTFPSSFVQKYMVKNYMYKGGGLDETKKKMSNFYVCPKTQISKIGLGSNGKVE